MNTATTVRCPFCKAGPGSPCRVGRSTRHGFAHPARRDAAATVPVAPVETGRGAQIIQFPARRRAT